MTITLHLYWWMWPIAALAVGLGAAAISLSRQSGDYSLDPMPMVWAATGVALFVGLIAGHFL